MLFDNGQGAPCPDTVDVLACHETKHARRNDWFGGSEERILNPHEREEDRGHGDNRRCAGFCRPRTRRGYRAGRRRLGPVGGLGAKCRRWGWWEPVAARTGQEMVPVAVAAGSLDRRSTRIPVHVTARISSSQH